MTLLNWILALIAPILVRAVGALGFSAVAYVGVEALIQTMITAAVDRWAGLPAYVLQLASVGGVPEALGMVFGAYISVFTAKFTISAYKLIFAPKAASIWSQM